MSAEVLRRAASQMRERAEAVPEQTRTDADVIGVWLNSRYHLTTPPTVALAVAKAMDDVARAWEIADEVADGYVYDADDNHYRFEETVDGGWLNVARAYLGSDA